MIRLALESHIIQALQGIASKKWHGKGCKRSNCGEVCLCAACHARTALEIINERGGKIRLKGKQHATFEETLP